MFGFDLEIQLKPIMQVYIKASVSKKGNLRGVFDLQSTAGNAVMSLLQNE